MAGGVQISKTLFLLKADFKEIKKQELHISKQPLAL